MAIQYVNLGLESCLGKFLSMGQIRTNGTGTDPILKTIFDFLFSTTFYISVPSVPSVPPFVFFFFLVFREL